MSPSRMSLSRSPRAELSPRAAVLVLALTQNIGYGTIFYSYATLAQGAGAEFGLSPTAGFVLISVALMVSGLCGTWFGRAIDRSHPARFLALGSIGAGLLYLLLAVAPGPLVVALAVVLLQVAGIAALYTAAFPLLSRFPEAQARRAMIWLSLAGGFASTLFWPVTGWGVDALGWRGTCALFGALHLFVAAPAHLWLLTRRLPVPAAAPKRAAKAAPGAAERLFWPLAISFGATGFVATVLMVHLVPLLEGARLGAALYQVTALVGPSMVVVRVASVLLWPGVHPLKLALWAAVLMPAGLIPLVGPLPPVLAGVALCVCYGIAHGLHVMVGGTLPLAVFGPEGFGALLGRVNRVRLLASAFAPALFALVQERIGPAAALWLLMAVGALGVVMLVDLARVLGRRGPTALPAQDRG